MLLDEARSVLESQPDFQRQLLKNWVTETCEKFHMVVLSFGMPSFIAKFQRLSITGAAANALRVRIATIHWKDCVKQCLLL